MKWALDNFAEVENWRAVNDGVMGGRSSGGANFEDGHLVFSGVINTNGGGFSSVRRDLTEGDLDGASSLKFRVKSDGRDYKVTIRTDAKRDWRYVAFQAPIPVAGAGQWTEATVDFKDLSTSIFGRPVSGFEFKPSKVISIGIIIADKKDGPFRFELSQIETC